MNQLELNKTPKNVVLTLLKTRSLFVLFFLVVLSFQLVLIPSVLADTSSTTTSAVGNVFSVTMLSQEPDPVRPGQYATVRFKIESKGIAGGILEVELFADAPVSVIHTGDTRTTDTGTTTAIKRLGTLRSTGTTDSVFVDWRVRIAENAAAGDVPLKLRYRLDGGGGTWITVTGFTLHVRPAAATISIKNVLTTPSQFAPGSNGVVEMYLFNAGSSTVRNLRILVDLTNTPYVPLNTGADQYVYLLEPGMTKKTELALQVQPDAKAKPYRIPVTLSFEDQTGTQYTTNTSIGISVGGLPKLDVLLQTTDLTSVDATGKIVLQVINIGLLDARFVTLTLEQAKQITVQETKKTEQEEYTILSPAQVYVGDISPDDFSTADFKVHIGKNARTPVVFRAFVSYSDNANNIVEKVFDVPIAIYSANEAVQLGIVPPSTAPWWIALLIVLIGIGSYIYWRKRR